MNKIILSDIDIFFYCFIIHMCIEALVRYINISKSFCQLAIKVKWFLPGCRGVGREREGEKEQAGKRGEK
jgi:hypothetical protein